MNFLGLLNRGKNQLFDSGKIGKLKELGYKPTTVDIEWDGKILVVFHRPNDGHGIYVDAGFIVPRSEGGVLRNFIKWQRQEIDGCVTNGAIVFRLEDGKVDHRATILGGGWCWGVVPNNVLSPIGVGALLEPLSALLEQQGLEG